VDVVSGPCHVPMQASTGAAEQLRCALRARRGEDDWLCATITTTLEPQAANPAPKAAASEEPDALSELDIGMVHLLRWEIC
jgi:hypothetical protein